ncbi:MAG: hypothetical protein WCO06_03110, partial [Candidatus Roizmanbacteria bacterium]
VKHIIIYKQYPDILQLYIDEYTPFAILKIRDGCLLLSEDGKILKKLRTLDPLQLPLISYYQQFGYTDFNAGELIAFIDISYTLSFLKVAKDMGLIIDSIDITGMNMIALKTKDKTYVFSTDKDRNLQIYQFKTLIEQLQVRGQFYISLDFRFSKPVIQTQEK